MKKRFFHLVSSRLGIANDSVALRRRRRSVFRIAYVFIVKRFSLLFHFVSDRNVLERARGVRTAAEDEANERNKNRIKDLL